MKALVTMEVVTNCNLKDLETSVVKAVLEHSSCVIAVVYIDVEEA